MNLAKKYENPGDPIENAKKQLYSRLVEVEKEIIGRFDGFPAEERTFLQNLLNKMMDSQKTIREKIQSLITIVDDIDHSRVKAMMKKDKENKKNQLNKSQGKTQNKSSQTESLTNSQIKAAQLSQIQKRIDLIASNRDQTLKKNQEKGNAAGHCTKYLEQLQSQYQQLKQKSNKTSSNEQNIFQRESIYKQAEKSIANNGNVSNAANLNGHKNSKVENSASFLNNSDLQSHLNSEIKSSFGNTSNDRILAKNLSNFEAFRSNQKYNSNELNSFAGESIFNKINLYNENSNQAYGKESLKKVNQRSRDSSIRQEFFEGSANNTQKFKKQSANSLCSVDSQAKQQTYLQKQGDGINQQGIYSFRSSQEKIKANIKGDLSTNLIINQQRTKNGSKKQIKSEIIQEQCQYQDEDEDFIEDNVKNAKSASKNYVTPGFRQSELSIRQNSQINQSFSNSKYSQRSEENIKWSGKNLKANQEMNILNGQSNNYDGKGFSIGYGENISNANLFQSPEQNMNMDRIVENLQGQYNISKFIKHSRLNDILEKIIRRIKTSTCTFAKPDFSNRTDLVQNMNKRNQCQIQSRKQLIGAIMKKTRRVSTNN